MRALVTEDWKCDKARIMVTTSSWSLGIHDTKIQREIQWGVKRLAVRF